MTLDELTCVEFIKQTGCMELTLKEGKLLLEVRDKLKEDETL